MNRKWFLYIVALGLSFFLWQKWQISTHPEWQEIPAEENATSTDALPPMPEQIGEKQDIPTQAAQGGQSGQTPEKAADIPTAENEDDSNRYITVKTDVIEAVIDTQGGTIREIKLLTYKRSLDNPRPLSLMRPTNPHLFMLQSGLVSQQDAPDHYAEFSAEQMHYELVDGKNELQVPLKWQNDEGLIVKKTFLFKRGEFDFRIQQNIDNQSAQNWTGFAYAQLLHGPEQRRKGLGQVYTYTGAVYSSSDTSYEKYDFKKMRKSALDLQTDTGWIAMIQQYFLGAIIPDQHQRSHIYTSALNNGNYVIGLSGTSMQLKPGEKSQYEISAYVGPKIQSKLRKVADKLDKTVDYGFLFMIAQPMFKVLKWIHDTLLGNWGWSIIVMTILIKLIFFVPSAWAYKSMAKMRRLGPEMQRLKENYGDDRQQMSQAMMELYRKEKVNPASGCLPIFFQIPFFIAFYWVLIESVELRQSPWIGWIQDLSVMDSMLILPITNMALMYIQQKLNPPPPDPMQAKVMQFLPLIFGILFMWFPAGLLLYWCVSNAFGIVQQSVMNKRYGEPRN